VGNVVSSLARPEVISTSSGPIAPAIEARTRICSSTAYAWIYNTSAVDEQIRVRASIAGAIGPEDVEITSGLARLLTTFPTRVTGLVTGGTFTIACQTYSVTDFTAHNTNMARISGTVLWLR